MSDTDKNHVASTKSVAFSRDGGTFITAHSNDTVEIWDVAPPRLLRTLQGLHEVFISSDGRILITVTVGRTRVSELASGTLLGTLDTDGAMALSPNGRILLDRSLRLWDVGSGRLLRKFDGPKYAYAAFSPDGKSLAEGVEGRSHRVQLWDVSSGKLLRTFERPCRRKDWGCGVRAVAFSPDGSALASASDYDFEVDLWDVASGRLQHELPQDDWSPDAIAFSEGGRTVAVVAGGFYGGQSKGDVLAKGYVSLWDVASGKLLRKRGLASFCVAFSLDGHTMAVGGALYAVTLLDANNGDTLQTLRGDTYWRAFKDNLMDALLFRKVT
jgi:WD40 repeat protein